MVIAVDDEQEVQPKGAASPTSKQEAELDIELTEKNQEQSGWKEVGEITLPGTIAVQSQTPTAKPTRRPRSPRHNRAPSAPRIPTNPTNDSASPAIAPTGLRPNQAPVQSSTSLPSTAQEDSSDPMDEIAQSSPVTSSPDEPAKSTETDSPSDTPLPESQSNYAPESAITESDASPAYVSQDELVPDSAQNQSSIGQPEEPVAGNTDEGDSVTPPPTATEPDEQKKNDGGGLKGVENTFDPYAASEPKNQGAAIGGTAAVAGAVGGAVVGGPAGAAAGAEAGAAVGGEAAAAGAATGAAETSSTVAAGQESAIARANRAETVGQQKSEQQKTEALNLDSKKIGLLQKQLNEFAEKEAGEIARKTYKQLWQFTQEGVEDWALSLTDFFLFSGPITVLLYVLRWILGNMMGDLFTKEVSLPGSTMIPGAGSAKVTINIFPPYELADMQDFERHFKVMLIGGVTLIIYGFIIMLLYYYTHWAEAIIAAVKAGWTAIITSIPAFQP